MLNFVSKWRNPHRFSISEKILDTMRYIICYHKEAKYMSIYVSKYKKYASIQWRLNQLSSIVLFSKY